MILKYFKLFLSLFNVSLKRSLENRVNTFGTLIANILGTFLFVIVIETVFLYTKNLNGWNRFEVIFLMGYSRFLLNFFTAILHSSLSTLPQYIHRGNLDIILTKPVSSQFMISLTRTKPFELLNSLSGVFICIYALNSGNLNIGFYNYILLLVSFITGIIILYSIFFILATTGIWISPFGSLGSIFHIITQPLTLPTNIYSKNISFLITYLIPIGFVVTVPIQLLFNKEPASIIFVSLLLATLLLSISIWFWNFALSHYTSASS